MEEPKKKWVAFNSNCRVPVGILDKDKEVKVQAGEPVQLPISYADHVVQDLYAVECDAPKKTRKKNAEPTAAEKKAAADKKAADEQAQRIIDAETAVSAATTALAAAAGTDAEEEAQKSLAAAEQVLADLKA